MFTLQSTQIFSTVLKNLRCIVITVLLNYYFQVAILLFPKLLLVGKQLLKQLVFCSM